MNDLISNVRLILTEPTKCWSKLTKKNVSDAATHLVLLFVVYGVLSIATMGLMGLFSFSAGMIALTLVSLVASLVMSFVAAWVYNLIIGLLGVKGDFADAFRPIAYGATPALLFGWIPFVGVLTSVWALVLQVIGWKELYGTDYVKVIVALVIEVVIFALIGVVLAATVGMTMMTLMFGGLGQF